MAFIFARSKSAGTKEEEYEDAMEELEVDVCALTLAFIFTQAVRFFVSGSYPVIKGEGEEHGGHGDGEHGGHGKGPEHHGHHGGFLQKAVAFTSAGLDLAHEKTTAYERGCFLIYTLVLVVIAVLILPRLNLESRERPKWARMSLSIFHHTLVMLIAWGLLLWAEWEFFDVLFVNVHDEMFGHVVFSLAASLVCCLMVLILAGLGEWVPNTLVAVLAVAMGLGCAWSWEHCFDLAIDNIAEAYHIIPGFCDATFLKIVVALACPFLLLPPYMRLVKPTVVMFEEEEEGGEGEKKEEK